MSTKCPYKCPIPLEIPESPQHSNLDLNELDFSSDSDLLIFKDEIIIREQEKKLWDVDKVPILFQNPGHI